MNRVHVGRVSIAAMCVSFLSADLWAQPTNTTLPGGASWQLAGTSQYDTGLQSTELGGLNGQTMPPYNDSSYGIMNESGAPWFTGNDLSAQQYVQNQIFGNFGTNSPPGPAGFRFFNFGYDSPATINSPAQMTNAGDNFPANARELRTVSLNHWSNPDPDSGGVASLGQMILVPTAATLTLSIGWGADEMILAVVGGGSGTSTFRADLNSYAMMRTSAFGGTIASGDTASDRNLINMNAIMEVNNAGAGDYGFDGAGEPWGFGIAPGANTIILTRNATDAVFEEGSFVSDPDQGIPVNSTGHSMTRAYDVLANLVEIGGIFDVEFESQTELFLARQLGNADARASAGPGMQGTAQLVVDYQIWTAIPEPTGATLTWLILLRLRKRRRKW